MIFAANRAAPDTPWQAIRDVLLAELAPLDKRELIIAGCDTGEPVWVFAPHFKQVVGIDVPGLDYMRKEIGRRGFTNVRLCSSGLLTFQYPSETDVVLAYDSLHYLNIHGVRVALGLMADAVRRRGGVVIVTAFTAGKYFEEHRYPLGGGRRTIYRYPPRDLLAAAEDAGLQQIRSEVSHPDPDKVLLVLRPV